MFEEYPDMVKVKDLRNMLGICKNKAYYLINSNEIKSFKIGSVTKIPKKWVIEYIENRK